MVAVPSPERLSPERLTVPLAAAGAAIVGGIAALALLVMPTGPLEAAVVRSGIPALLAAAEPPLGLTARFALALLIGGSLAVFTWFGLYLMVGSRAVGLGDAAALLRRGDAHPDAPPRPPLSADRELGTPFLEVKAPAAPPPERDLPIDLDQPMAAFDPAAVPATPLAPPEPVAPLARAVPEPEPEPEPAPVFASPPPLRADPPAPARPQLIDPGDRFETFEMTPLRRPEPEPAPRPLSLRVPPRCSLRATTLRDDPPAAPPPAALPVVAPQTETTIHALLARLERGIAANDAAPRRAPASGGLEHTLGDLRRLATGGR